MHLRAREVRNFMSAGRLHGRPKDPGVSVAWVYALLRAGEPIGFKIKGTRAVRIARGYL